MSTGDSFDAVVPVGSASPVLINVKKAYPFGTGKAPLPPSPPPPDPDPQAVRNTPPIPDAISLRKSLLLVVVIDPPMTDIAL